ncbi:MDR family MFS transporter [Chengkuizengella axinellae]|uniref:MFS transporter n=1 Tax=Chengkuizengella axinellae TaxID=3064388 RepID=A0ABT9J425_9BACL|nr:MFS transporter [Chengkuizengella sp. 2205SS18-9]MDP5276391.1 MFS transporter [Chengkuizengella sp. 2205SS18-9]
MHKIKKRYDAPIWVRLFGELLTSTTGSMLAPFLVIYLHQKLDGSVLLPMLIIGLQPLSEIFVTLLGGRLTDRFGRKSITLIALFLQASAMAGFIFADSIVLFVILYMMNGIGRGLYIPAQRAQITDATEEGKRAEVFAVINTAGAIGMAIGPLLGSIIFFYNPVIIFGMEASALLVYLLVVWLKMPETVPVVHREIHSSNNEIKKRYTFIQMITKHYVVLGLMVFTLPISFFYSQLESNYRIYIQELFPNFIFILAILSSVKAIMDIILQIGLVKWTERLSMQKVVVISYGSYVIAAIFYGISSNLTLLLVTQLILVVAESIGLNHFLKFVAKLAPEHQRGLYFSIYGTHWDISRFVGPFLGGLIFLHFGGAALFYLAAIFLVIGGVCQFFFVKYIEDTKSRIDRIHKYSA